MGCDLVNLYIIFCIDCRMNINLYMYYININISDKEINGCLS